MRLEIGRRFASFEWPDGATLFDRDTGDTHTMDPFAFFLIQASVSQSGDLGLKALLEKYAALSGISLTAELRQAGSQAYEQLRSKGLIDQGYA